MTSQTSSSSEPTPVPRDAPAAVSSLALLRQAGSKDVPPPEPMPLPDQRLLLPMRDGIRLDTNVWLPPSAVGGRSRVPAILLRTPYKESVMGFKRLGVLRYVESGYAVVIQQIRGVGHSEGRFAFNSAHDPADGFDTVEWIAAQPWCDGAVGMDGSSYVAMTQLTTAIARPPHLRCIVPAVPSVDFFNEVPYRGGVFVRLHGLTWTQLLQVASLRELVGGFAATLPVLSQPDMLDRVMARPAIDAAEGVLHGDFLAHYRDALEHPVFDDWWRARTLLEEDCARIDVPVLVVSGNFDLGVGALTLWRRLHADRTPDAWLLVGPWDHGQCYAGGGDAHGPYAFGDAARIDLAGLRLAFFDRHLKGIGAGPELGGRVRLFITGVNAWRVFDRYPPAEVATQSWYLHSGGHANSARGDGRLSRGRPGDEVPDAFVDDPSLPFVAALAAAHEATRPLDLRERERDHETLVYSGPVLAEPCTVLGEPEAELWVAADAPDADVVVWLAERRADGQTVQLAQGQLRLRYRSGFHVETLLVPGEPVRVRIRLTYVAHRVPPGSQLRLLVSGGDFPQNDPNPHTGEPIATATTVRPARQHVFHDAQRDSLLRLPVLP